MRHILHTDFASPERLPYLALQEQVNFVDARFDQDQLGEALPDVLTIINEHRQVVYANSRLFELLNETKESIMGRRTGEIFDCVNASKSEGGCGTTEFCRECGSLRAILDAQSGKQSIQEWRLLNNNGKAFDLQVWATPTYLGTKPFTIYALKDISAEKRRAALERTFFHDLLNSASSVHYVSELLKSGEQNASEFVDILSRNSIQMVNEIRSHHALMEAEGGELALTIEKINPNQLLGSIATLNRASKAAKDKNIDVKASPEVKSVLTDLTILGRCLNNLVKNALEATDEDHSITMECCDDGSGIRFSVSNPGYIPRSSQLQIFQRSFTTKGNGRGLGTYSVKLFVEQYLGGRVWFKSSQADGTTFYIYIPESRPA